jgi:hypothetical protein
MRISLILNPCALLPYSIDRLGFQTSWNQTDVKFDRIFCRQGLREVLSRSPFQSRTSSRITTFVPLTHLVVDVQYRDRIIAKLLSGGLLCELIIFAVKQIQDVVKDGNYGCGGSRSPVSCWRSHE